MIEKSGLVSPFMAAIAATLLVVWPGEWRDPSLL